MSGASAIPELDVVLPVHNEGGTIEATLREWFAELSPRLAVNFIVCEDGSTDDTKDILRTCARDLPMALRLGEERKGYSPAVIDGLKASRAPYVLAVDSDGQCDPADFWQFWQRREDFDVIIGRRTRRADPWFRRAMSGAFKLWYRALLGVPIADPSCPYVLVRRAALNRLIPDLGVLDPGLWWEFTARAYRTGVPLLELEIHHRRRRSGATQVFKWRKMPRIGLAHALGLFTIWRQTR
jgi:glycosyltransferase involved in cell wall biosynthesis